MKLVIPHCGTENDYSCEGGRVTYAEDGRFFKMSFSRSPAMEWNQEMFVHRGKRGVCRGFSCGSRRRLTDRLNQVSCAAELPVEVGLTFPDECFDEDTSRLFKTAKLHLDVLFKRLARVCPSACGFWKMEWKPRLSGKYIDRLFPHFHLMIWGLPTRCVGREEFGSGGREWWEEFVPERDSQLAFAGLCSKVCHEHVFKGYSSACKTFERAVRAESKAELPKGDVNGYISFRDWLSMGWYHVVGSGNVAHFLAGTHVNQICSWRGVVWYFAKYFTKPDSDGVLGQIPTGRCWGVFNRGSMPWAKMVELDLDNDVACRVRRIARRYLEHQVGHRIQRHFGITIYCNVARFIRVLDREPDAPF